MATSAPAPHIDNTVQAVHDSKQVTKLEQLVPGSRYRDMQGPNQTLYCGTIEVLEVVASTEDGKSPIIKARIIEAGDSPTYKALLASGKPEIELHAADFSIVPYKTGDGDRWHPYNYLMPV